MLRIGRRGRGGPFPQGAPAGRVSLELPGTGGIAEGEEPKPGWDALKGACKTFAFQLLSPFSFSSINMCGGHTCVHVLMHPPKGFSYREWSESYEERLTGHWLPPGLSDGVPTCHTSVSRNGSQSSTSSENAGVHAALGLQKVPSSFIPLGILAPPASLPTCVTLDRLLRCPPRRFPPQWHEMTIGTPRSQPRAITASC